MDALIALLETFGPAMFLGLIGVYLIIVSIAGQFIPRNIRIKTNKQRVLLGLFGFVLFMPTLVSLYIEFFTVFTPSIFSPETPEQVIDQEQTSGETTGEQATNQLFRFAHLAEQSPPADFAQQTGRQNVNDNCQLVERFGLSENSSRRLKHSHFGKRIFVSVSEIHYRRPFEVFVVISEHIDWPKEGTLSHSELQHQIKQETPEAVLQLQVHKSGDVINFEYKEQRYQLKIDRIYAVLFGSDKVIISICKKEDEK